MSHQPGPSSARSEPELLGLEFGAWRVLRFLGSGKMGSVYLVEHRANGTLAASKFLHTHLVTDSASRTRFETEVQAISRLSHPNIVSVFDFGAMPSGRPWFVMENLEGVTLEVELEDQGLPLERIARIVAQVAAALDVAHGVGVIHRDLKPANVMVMKVGGVDFVKVVDFGIAKLREHIGANGMVGTPDFMAPEQIRGDEVDARTDVYALGVMTWQLLVGLPPFGHGPVAEVLRAHLEEAPPHPALFRPGLPDGACAAVLKALAKHAGQRFPSASAFADAFHEAVRHDAVRAVVVRATPLPIHARQTLEGHARSRRAILMLDDVAHPVTCEQESSLGCFVAADFFPPPLKEALLQSPVFGALLVRVVRSVDAVWSPEGQPRAGFFLQFLNVTAHQQALLDGSGDADEFAAGEALTRSRARLWGDAYSALGVRADASSDELADAYQRASEELAVFDWRKISAARRRELDDARRKLSVCWVTVGERVRRAAYDANRSNWRGIAAGRRGGLTRDEVAGLRSAYLLANRDALANGEVFREAAEEALEERNLGGAREALERALATDPLNLSHHDAWAVLASLREDEG